MPNILACTDGSTHSPSVCQHAAWAALQLNARVQLLHVINHHRERTHTLDLSGAIGLDATAHLTEQLAQLEETEGRAALLRGQQILQTARQHLADAGVADPTLTLRHGALIPTLAELQPSATLLVIGKSGAHAVLAPGQVGGHLEHLIRASPLPVLVAEQTFRPIQRFLIAFDNSPPSRKAVSHIAASPLLRSLPCHLLMVGRGDPAHQTALDAAQSQLTHAGFHVTATLLPGSPAPAIAAHLKTNHIDLLAMGAYGHSQIREFFVGSATTKLVRTSQTSVLLFP